MRQLTIKYAGQCARCGADFEVGVPAMYEKSMGIFCLGHEPTDIEDIRAFRLAKGAAKADKLDEWAENREKKAEAQLNSYPEIRHDIAFITQPGHIPFRARMNAADDRACESLKKAEHMRDRADSLRNVRVKGDADRKRQECRERHDKVICKGSRVMDYGLGEGVVLAVFPKSYRIKFDRGFTHSIDKSFVFPVKSEAVAA